ncbi:MAG: BrxA family protein, partial [Desulfohalobiaceae bacterium]
MAASRYKGDIVAGSLLVPESRKVANLLLQGFEGKPLVQKVLEDNLLQKRSPVTAQRQARLIVARLTPLGSSFWQIVEDGSWSRPPRPCSVLLSNTATFWVILSSRPPAIQGAFGQCRAVQRDRFLHLDYKPEHELRMRAFLQTIEDQLHKRQPDLRYAHIN